MTVVESDTANVIAVRSFILNADLKEPSAAEILHTGSHIVEAFCIIAQIKEAVRIIDLPDAFQRALKLPSDKFIREHFFFQYCDAYKYPAAQSFPQ